MLSFISPAGLIGQAELKLRSYVSAGLVDTPGFYQLLKNELGLLGLGVKEEAAWILPIHRYKVAKPAELVDFWGVYLVDGPEPTTGRLLSYTPPMQRPGFAAQIHGGSPCRKQPGGEFTEDARHFLFTTETGWVMIQGWQMPRLDGSMLVPEEPIVQRWLENALVYRTIYDLYLNGEVNDLERRLQLTQLDYERSFDEAKTWKKTPSFKQLLAWKNTWHGKLLTRYQL